MSRDLLPPNASPWARASSETSARMLDVPSELVRTVKRPETCPPELLAYLAFERSVRVWENAWPVQTKRDVVAAAYAIKARAGTLGGLGRAIDALGMGLQIREWFDYGGQPYRFRLAMTLPQGASWTVREQQIVFRTALGAKNARSRLEALEIAMRGPEVGVFVGACFRGRIRIRPSVLPVSEITGAAPLWVGSVFASRIRIRPVA